MLICNECDGQYDGGSAGAVQFTVLDKRGKVIARHVRRGRPLLVEARLENNNFTDGQEVARCRFNFVVLKLEFGAPGEASPRELEQTR